MKRRVWKYLADKVNIANSIELEFAHLGMATDLNSLCLVVIRNIKKKHCEGEIYSTINKVKALEFLK